MRTFLSALRPLACLLALAVCLHAQESDGMSFLTPFPVAPTPEPPVAIEPLPPAEPPTPNVRIEALLVVLPGEKAAAFLPDLRDDAKIDAAYQRLVESIQRQEATLIGCPVILATAGTKSSSETITEKMYPTQFWRGADPFPASTPAPDRLPPGINFEKRGLGHTMEATATVSPDGQMVTVALQLQQVDLLQFDPPVLARNEVGQAVELAQPRFTSEKSSVSQTVRSGQRFLAGVHQLTKPEGAVELFVCRATVVPVP